MWNPFNSTTIHYSIGLTSKSLNSGIVGWAIQNIAWLVIGAMAIYIIVKVLSNRKVRDSITRYS